MTRRAAAWGLLGLLGGSVLAADLLGRQLGLGALGARPEPGAPRVALTFDDGPSPFTPDLLDLLARHGTQATFFLTGERVRRDPHALQAMRDAGHQLESHGLTHRHALTLTPWQEARHVSWHPDPARPGRLYRPPWGGHSPFTRLLTRLAGARVALWSAESRDWLPQDGHTLALDLLRTVRAGDVILLHDGPDAGRAERTRALLVTLLPALQERGLRPVLLNDLPPGRIGLRDGWRRLHAMWRAPTSR
ncbi:polysaccharide deacetylase [Deinococcus aquiradiocola]|uniref:Polysaccharide deacetylase n=1 Tax=Deinococcus aquiradiocola TaxID=393059 RepID=A0A917PMJ4_9DEIO|nr:polysaccharide deacetylase [Deinococcus aquiradiocola]